MAQAGYENFTSLDLAENAPRVAEEALALLTAAPCPAERSTLILGGEQLALQVHESVGHAVELDRVLGREASYAGTSFVSAPDLGSLRYGSAAMNVTADATSPGGLGSFGWDDEGVAGHAQPIIREGVLRGFLSSRESAAEIGLERSGGCMRAEGFSRQPIIRMTNVNLEPGDAGTLEDLIADTDSGIYMETNRSWSIDYAPAPVPVRHRDRLGDTRRQARPHAAQPELRGRDARVLGQPRRRLWSAGLAPVGRAQLRQGRAGPVDARLAWSRARRASATCRLEWRDGRPRARPARARGGGAAATARSPS